MTGERNEVPQPRPSRPDVRSFDLSRALRINHHAGPSTLQGVKTW
jgi:hypothetical protein